MSKEQIELARDVLHQKEGINSYAERELVAQSYSAPLAPALKPEKNPPYPFQIYNDLKLQNQYLRQIVPEETDVFEENLKVLQNLMRSMWFKMVAYRGCGLAAPQVGFQKRVVVVDLSFGEYTQPLLMINPRIIKKSEDFQMSEEGCLSLPGVFVKVKRHLWVVLQYIDAKGFFVEEDHFAETASTAVQHELNHLDGVLAIDHLSRLQRNFAMKDYRKRFPRNLVTQK